MRFGKIVLAIISTFCPSFSGGFVELSCKDWKLERRLEKEWSSLAFLKRNNEEQAILKQLKGHPVRFISNLVADDVGAFIAQSAHILSNRVSIVPDHHACMYKTMAHQPASLHSFIGGHTLEQNPGKIRKSIVQLTFIGNQRIHGLTRHGINAMTAHPDLPNIAAIDTFMGNTDRLPKNIIHNKSTNRLYAIDFTLAFSTNLARHTIKHLRSLLRKKVHFNQSELKALKTYKSTLKYLLTIHTPHSLETRIHESLQETGFLSNKHYSSSTKKAVTQKINQYKQITRESFVSSQELVSLLDTVS